MYPQFVNRNTMNPQVSPLPPARLNAEQTGKILGFQEHDIPILVAAKLLKPLGKPLPNATKYFAAVDVYRCFEDSSWLNKATQTVYDHWKSKNERKATNVIPMQSVKEETSLAA